MGNKVGSWAIRAPLRPGWLHALRDWYIRFQDNKLAVVGLVIVIAMYLVGAFAPQLSLHDPNQMNLRERLAPISWTHPFGTDNFGRDLYSRVIYGTRISIVAGAGSTLMALLVGVFLGAISGFAGKVVDNVIMRIMDAIM